MDEPAFSAPRLASGQTGPEPGQGRGGRRFSLSDIRPTVRRRVARASSFAVVAVVLILAVALADWRRVGRQFFNLEVLAQIWPNVIVIALRNTLLYTLVAFVVGTVFAIILALMKMAKGPARWFAVGFIELFRGLPALLTIFMCAFMIPIAFGYHLPGGSMGAGLFGLILVTSAYNAEVIRSGIEAIPKGQREAARSLGMTHLSTMVHIILPQGLRVVIPPLTNEFVMLLKDSALLFIAGLASTERELTTFGRDGMTTYASATPLIVVAVCYLVVTIPLTYLVSLLEKKMAVKK
ncbi:MAG: amino acid ABC transporter permease [Propionibacteriaceae bacterium]|jgi:polar amino acid transport system permease protein|nr:amino acid ABC transporter permease [Propionibacteriaceae bacterium]